MTSMTTLTTLTTLVTTRSICLGEDGWLDLTELALASQVEPGFIRQLIDEGMLEPGPASPDARFGGEDLARVRRIVRLQRDFEASLASVGLMLDLLDEIDRLQGLLRRAGLPADDFP